MKRVCILGSTGSVGRQTIEVCKDLGYEVVGVSARSNTDLLAAQISKLRPKYAWTQTEEKANELKQKIGDTDTKIFVGEDGLDALAAADCDITVNAVVGIAGLSPTLSAINAGHDVALANKETLVAGGKIVIGAAKRKNVRILPVDSEHSAIFQAMQGNNSRQVKKVILTASGGPFYGKTAAELENVTVEQALKHPNWSMGAKITVDSATLMNKGLELIEACRLFGKNPDEVEIVVHRESVVHSLVEYDDNAVIAQLGTPDMKLPIQYALTYPDRLPCGTKRLSLTDYGTLTFSKPDIDTFVCLRACIEAMNKGGVYPAIVNGANEQAVELFLNGKIKFLDIGRLVYGSLSLKFDVEEYEINDIMTADNLAREYVRSLV